MTTSVATQETLPAILKAAKGGDLIKLQGAFKPFSARRLAFDTPLTIDATHAQIEEWYWSDIVGVNFVGGVWLGGSTASTACLRIDGAKRVQILGGEFFGGTRFGKIPNGYAVSILRGENIHVSELAAEGFRSGVVFNRVDGFSAKRSTFRGARSDGINVAQSWNGVVEGNTFRDTVITGDEHPDAIQLWSRADAKPTSDILVQGNDIEGAMEGVTAFNHARSYPAGTVLADGRELKVAEELDDGGFDRIQILNNTIRVGYAQAVAVYSGRGVVVSGNDVSTREGSKYQAQINLIDCTGLVRSGNAVAAGAGKVAVIDIGETSPTVPADDPLREIVARRTSVKQEPLKTKGRVSLDFRTPAEADAFLAAVLAILPA